MSDKAELYHAVNWLHDLKSLEGGAVLKVVCDLDYERHNLQEQIKLLRAKLDKIQEVLHDN